MVSCDSCISRLDDLERNDEKAQDVYDVGNPAREQMGHEMFHSAEGRTSLCSAKKRAS